MASALDVTTLAARAGNLHAHTRRARRLIKGGLTPLRRRPPPLDQRALLFILGCQRSGTSLLLQVFERDWACRTFGEQGHRLVSEDVRSNIRLNPLDKVRNALEALRYPFFVMKPLVESQHARRLLTTFPAARIVWLYRDFREVAASNLGRWGMANGVANLRPIVENSRGDWRGEAVDAATRELIGRHFREDMNPYDAAALFWYVRNVQFFDNGLDREDTRHRVLLLPYERLVQEPVEVVRRLYGMVERPFPGPGLTARIHPRFMGKGRDIGLSREVEAVCQDLLRRLDALARHHR